MAVKIIWSTFLVVKEQLDDTREKNSLMETVIQMAKSLVACQRKNGYSSLRKQENSCMRLNSKDKMESLPMGL